MKRATRRIWGAAFLLALCLVGCAEQAAIHTYPPGARVMINDKFVGVSPVEYRVARSDWQENPTLRIERQGYQTLTGRLPTGAVPSRIVGIVLTSGVLLVFKRPTTFKQDRFDFELLPLSDLQFGGTEATPPTQPRTAEESRPEPSPVQPSGCTTEQILSLKNSGLSDAQIRSACREAR